MVWPTATTASADTPPEISAMQPPEKYLKKHEVAQLLNKSVRTVEHWMRDGILPYFKLGRTVRFLWSDVKAHLDAKYRVGRRR